MGFKVEVQDRDEEKLREKINDMPKFIRDYFVFLNSSTSKLTYWSTISLFLNWLIDNKIINNSIENITKEDLNLVTDVDVVNYLDFLLKRKKVIKISKKTQEAKELIIKISPDTAQIKKNIIRGFWGYLVDKKYVSYNIITKAVSKKYKVEDKDKEVDIPTEEQLDFLLMNLEKIKSEIIAIRNIAIVKLFKGTGVRISELVGLDVDDLHFDLEKPKITIMAKGKKKSRDILVSNSAIDAVNDYLKIRNSNPDLRDLKPLFLSEHKDKNGNNNRLAVKSVEDFMSKYSNKTIHPHMLRHYAGTKMYESNHDLDGVCDQLGHSDINTTRKHYVKSNKQNMMDALNSF